MDFQAGVLNVSVLHWILYNVSYLIQPHSTNWHTMYGVKAHCCVLALEPGYTLHSQHENNHTVWEHPLLTILKAS